MTKAMNDALARIARTALDRAGLHGLREAELKDWVIRRAGDALVVSVEAGEPGDEGDLRSALCRVRGTFVVGPRGGIRALSNGRTSQRDLRKYPLVYGFRD